MGRYATEEELEAVAGELREAEVEDQPVAESPEEPEPEEGEDTPEGDEVGEESPDDTDEEPDDQEPGEPDEPTFTVTVNGVSQEVSQSELVKGYMRTADYTRKTQLLADQRRQLEDANQLILSLERNPQATLTVLARHYNVTGYTGEEGEEPEGPSPEQVRIMELEQWARTEQMRQREVAVDAELLRLHRDYGEFDEDALFTYAVEHRVPDLETALRAMTFGKTAAVRRTAKRATTAVAGGGSRNGAAHPKQPPERISKFSDAYEAAKRELEMS